MTEIYRSAGGEHVPRFARPRTIAGVVVLLYLLLSPMLGEESAGLRSRTLQWPIIVSQSEFSLGEREHMSCAAWSPDGARIACVENAFHDFGGLTARNRLWILDRVGQSDCSQRLVGEVPLSGLTGDVLWPKPGNYLYVVRQRVPRTKLHGSLYRVRVSDGVFEEILRWPTSTVVWAAAASPDGRYVALDMDAKLRILDLTTRKLRTIYRWRPTGGFGLGWSPDGKTLVFAKNRKLCFISPNGKGLKETRIEGTRCAWSPDGSWILITRSTNDGRMPDGVEINPRIQAWVVRPDGTGAHPLASDRKSEQMFVQWAPTGDRIFFSQLEVRQGPLPQHWYLARLGEGRAAR